VEIFLALRSDRRVQASVLLPSKLSRGRARR
jgi:hypothetical protein